VQVDSEVTHAEAAANTHTSRGSGRRPEGQAPITYDRVDDPSVEAEEDQ
jgi:hypothetical protein